MSFLYDFVFFNDEHYYLIDEFDINNNFHQSDFNFTGNISELNTSHIDFINTIWYVRPAWEVALKSILFLPVVLGGLLGNAILLHLLLKKKSMQTPTNILIGSIAIVDFTTLLLCPWMFLTNHFCQNYELGAIGCKLEGFLSGALLVTNVMLLSAVSCDRLMAIILPREARLTRKGAIRLSIIAFAIGIIFALPLCIYRTYRERQWKNFLEKYCAENIKVLPIYWHVLLATLVWFPTLVMIMCYSTIFWKLDRYEKAILRREHPISVNYKMRVARTLFIVLITFIVCRTPFTVLVFWRNDLLKKAQINSISSSFQTLWFISHYLICLNCAMNPIIYGLTNENYKKAFNSTPMYKFLSGNTNIMKESKRKNKTNSRSTDTNEKKKKFTLSFWPFNKKMGNISTSNMNIVAVSEIVEKKMHSPNVVCSGMVLLNDDDHI